MPTLVAFASTLTAGLLALGLVELCRRLALAHGWFDRPNGRDGGPAYRAIPRVGGAGMMLGVVACLAPISTLAGSFDSTFLVAALLPALVAGATGMLDDIRPMSPAIKGVVLLELGFFSWWCGIEVPVPGGSPWWLAASATAAWFVAVPTALNFVDGLDGLAAGITVIASLALAALGLVVGDPTVSLVALATAAATAGFWWHNRHPARIFMGDGGAMFLGYILAALAARVLVGAPALDVQAAVLLAITVPLVDLTLAIARRLRRLAPFSSDADHIHHRMARRLGHRDAVLALHHAALVAALVGLALAVPAGALPLSPAWIAVGVALLALPSKSRRHGLAPALAAATILLVAVPRASTFPENDATAAPPPRPASAVEMAAAPPAMLPPPGDSPLGEHALP